MEFTKFYRIQGGTSYNSSREMLEVSGTQLKIKNNKVHTYIHISSEEHMKYFLALRMGVESLDDIDELADLSGKKIEIIEMHLPEFFKHFLRDYSVSHYLSAAKDDIKPPPQLVDPTTPRRFLCHKKCLESYITRMLCIFKKTPSKE